MPRSRTVREFVQAETKPCHDRISAQAGTNAVIAIVPAAGVLHIVTNAPAKARRQMYVDLASLLMDEAAKLAKEAESGIILPAGSISGPASAGR